VERARSGRALSALRTCSRSKLDQEIESLRQKLRAAAFVDGKEDLAKLMSNLDRDNSGSISFDEFRRGSRSTGKLTLAAVSNAQLKKVFDFIDVDNSGEVCGCAVWPAPPPAPPPPSTHHPAVCADLNGQLCENRSRLQSLSHGCADPDWSCIESSRMATCELRLGVPGLFEAVSSDRVVNGYSILSFLIRTPVCDTTYK
jgi:hypothetical protein